MKVALVTKAVTPTHHFGGLQKYVQALATELTALGVQVEVISSLPKRPAPPAFELNQIRYTFLPPCFEDQMSSPTGWLWMHAWSLRVANYLKETDADIIHGFEMSLFYYFIKNKVRKPTVCHPFLDTHRIRSIQRAQMKKSLGVALKHPILFSLKLLPMKVCFEECSILASEGEFHQTELTEDYGVPEEKMFPIRVGVDLSAIRLKLTRAPVLTREALGLSQEDCIGITVNRFGIEKGLDTLIQSLPWIENPKLKLLLVGKGPLEDEIHQQLVQMNCQKRVVHIREATEEELFDLYRLSDFYVSPTLQDDYIMGIQEAMACSLPVISTGQDWLVNEKENGLLVPKRNPKALAQAMSVLCESSSLRESYGQSSLKRIEPYDWKVIARETLKQYERLL